MQDLTDSPADSSQGADSSQSLADPSDSSGSAGENSPSTARRKAALRGDQVARKPSFIFFGIVAATSLLADATSKAWAEVVLSKRTLLDPSLTVLQDHLAFTLAYNKGGAWGLFQNESELVRRPFFLLVSVAAIAFIVRLYSALKPGQEALRWGLPLVLGGALGNLTDRVVRSSVVDFVDYRANWVETVNSWVATGLGRTGSGWGVTDHWPTFNVADIVICVGVGLMAVDMFLSKRGQASDSGPSTTEDSGH